VSRASVQSGIYNDMHVLGLAAWRIGYVDFLTVGPVGKGVILVLLFGNMEFAKENDTVELNFYITRNFVL